MRLSSARRVAWMLASWRDSHRMRLVRRMMSGGVTAAASTLYDIPVSNNGARVRMILYYKDVPLSEVQIESPMVIGGTKSEKYLEEINAQGKVPAFDDSELGISIPESDTIARHLGGKYNTRPETKGDFALKPGTLKAVLADRITRHHDIYLASIQGCLYKASPRLQPFAYLGSREDALDEFQAQLIRLESLIPAIEEGPYLLGKEPTQADVALFPTLVFAERMLPKFENRAFSLEPKLNTWFQFMLSGKDIVAKRIYDEISQSLDAWESNQRWDPILGAGKKDTNPATIFDKVIAGEIPADIVYEDDLCLAFKDINPVAPTHVLLIPKQRSGLTQLQFAEDDHIFLLGHLMSKVGHIATTVLGLESYRLVVNDGAKAGQTVFHLHLHIIGGRALAWPPG